MRVCWIAGDELVADDRGELLLEPTRVRERCDRLAARDLLNLKTAYKAISEANSGEPDRQLLEEVADLAASRSASPAPRFLKDFAVNQTQRALYAQHRLCSAVMHPGELATDQGAMILATRLIDEVAVLAVAFSRPIGRILVEEPF